jgi:hypothetical protein
MIAPIADLAGEDEEGFVETTAWQWRRLMVICNARSANAITAGRAARRADHPLGAERLQQLAKAQGALHAVRQSEPSSPDALT